MEKIHSRDIRNVCLLGHGASGKTSLAEAMLYLTKGTDRLGKPSDGNTVCDYDPEEIKRGFSLSASIAPITYKGAKINIIDTPGYLDFIGEVVQAMRVAESALIVVDGKAGVEVGTELAWDMVCDAKMPRAFFINKCDDPEARFKRVFGQMHEMFGQSVCPVIIPLMEGDNIVGLLDLIEMKATGFGKNNAGKEIAVPAGNEERIEVCRNMLYEAVASTSEELMEKYFNGDELTREEVVTALHGGILTGDIAPVICGSAANLCGIDLLMDLIVETLPSPIYHKAETIVENGEEKEIPLKEHGPASIFVFKTIADPFVGKMSFFKVMSGELYSDAALKNLTNGQSERLSHIYTICGKKQTLCRCIPESCRGVVSSAVHLFEYDEDISRRVVSLFKTKNLRVLQDFLIKELAAALSDAVGDELSHYSVTFAPRSAKNIRVYGFDQARILCEGLSDALHIPMTEPFRHARRFGEQKLLDSEKRAENAEKSYALRRRWTRESERLILVDDVVTTGNTAARLARLAREAGYSEILLATAARTPYRKNEQKSEDEECRLLKKV